ncbi:putative integral membrane transport protein [Beutenbergia cavernae DSM 12333]|uniref:Putative integral membrane transport protein n=1 Tax=Beutenbergia cavernae (strain ATCC BAA-8 / DSM 12333 / CCUG 43141 / JCM 11478 / NBRC 16432 / NCIMB 13614 / HKI 0122) TaxID=471853 RepID=C5BY95_BEUC1|nr:hypothetical protein [Beutenbergia cavernae]ACQ80995.1 putative integral membrane transport protein [Beutenbergia cavernae DSM 12333]
MVATLARLKLALLRNSLKRDVWRIVAMAFGALYGLGLLLLLAVGLFALGSVEPPWRETIVVLGGSAIVLGWAIVPLLAFGVDDTLDPQRFSLFTTPSRAFAVGLLVAGAVSVPGAITVLVAFGPALAWRDAPLAALAALVCAPLGALACLLGARLTTSSLAGALRGRRGRDMVGIVSVLLILAVSLLPATLQSWGLPAAGDWLPALANVLAWTPLGAPWAVPADVAAGAWGLAGLRTLVLLAWLGAGLALWRRLLGHVMTTVGSDQRATRSRTGRLPLAEALTRRGVPSRAAAVAGRSVRYWRSDPRYLTSAASLLVMPVVAVVVAFAISSSDESGIDAADALGWVALAAAPIIAWFGGWTMHNDVAYDSTAFWLHVSSGLDGRSDRLGRTLGASVWMVPLVVLVAIAGPASTGRGEMVPAVLGASLGLLGCGLGVAAVCSAVLVYPVPPPGANPMSSQSGDVGATIAGQLLSSVGTIVAAVPTLLALLPALLVSPTWGWLTLVVGLASACGAIVVGVRWGGSLLDRREVTILTSMSSWRKR